MKTAATVALAVVGTVAVAGVGYGGYQALNDEGPYAEVVKVEPATKTWQEPNQGCEQVTGQRQKPVKDKHQIAGSAIGAVVGGVIGHQFGGGSGKDVLYGGAGDDILNGGSGADVLYGGDGDDVLSGGAGTDGAPGGDGADRYSLPSSPGTAPLPRGGRPGAGSARVAGLRRQLPGPRQSEGSRRPVPGL